MFQKSFSSRSVMKLFIFHSCIVSAANCSSWQFSLYSSECILKSKLLKVRGRSRETPCLDHKWESWTLKEQYLLCLALNSSDSEFQDRSSTAFWYVALCTLYSVRAKSRTMRTWCLLIYILLILTLKDVRKIDMQFLSMPENDWCSTISCWNKMHIDEWLQRTKIWSNQRNWAITCYLNSTSARSKAYYQSEEQFLLLCL